MSFLKSKNSKEQKSLPMDVAQKIRRELREWYGSLSVRELSMNRALIEEIEKLERLLTKGAIAV